MRGLFRQILLAALALATQAVPAAETVRAADTEPRPLLVFAAASLTDALTKVGDRYTASSGVPVKFSFAASSVLAKQIEAGAGADVFFSADEEWMDYLAQRGLIDPGSRQDVLGNRLVLIAPLGSEADLRLVANAPLLDALGTQGALATGDPDSVPVGRYAKAALTSLGIWDALQSRLVRAENVRIALLYVARREATLGIVYATDAAVEPRVRVVDVFPEGSHPPITYPVAATKRAPPQAAGFIRYLRSEPAQAAFASAGFTLLPVAGRH
jgi:molybdate transport system substrate-binding protein